MTLTFNGTFLFAGANDPLKQAGVYRSSDNGDSWVPANSGLTGAASDIWSLAEANSSPFAGTGAGVYRSINNGDSWVSASTGDLAGNDVKALVVNGSNIFAGINGCRIFLSNDNAQTWVAKNSGLPAGSVFVFVLEGTHLSWGLQRVSIFQPMMG